MSNIAGDYGVEINELLTHINRITVPARPDPDWTQIREQQRRLNGKSVLLQTEHRHRARLVKDRDWVEADIHGFERALVLVSGDGNDATGAGLVRLERRLEIAMARVSELTGEIDEVDTRIRQTESEIVSTQQSLVVLLRRSISDAEEKIRAAKQARLQRKAQFKVSMAGFDETPLWSPYAVMGYRVWSVRNTGLYGAWKEWETPNLDAVCDVGGDLPHTDGSCADVAFGCGIYASKSPLDLIEAVAGSSTKGFAAGLVGMEGKVIEHQSGYRAASATVLALAVAEDGVVRLIDDPGELETLFAQAAKAPGLGDVRFPMIQDAESMREIMAEYLEDQAQRRATWTSASPNE